MTEQQIAKANEALAILDRAAITAVMNRQDHANSQLAAQFLRELFAEEAKHVTPPPIT